MRLVYHGPAPVYFPTPGSGNLNACSQRRRSGSPVFNLQIAEVGKIRQVCGYERQVVDGGDRRDLPIYIRRCSADANQTCPLGGVPFSGYGVVGKNRQICQDDVIEVCLEIQPSSRRRKSEGSEAQFMQYWRGCGHFVSVYLQALEQPWIRGWPHSLAEYVCVQQIAHAPLPMEVAAGSPVAQRVEVLRPEIELVEVNRLAPQLERFPEICLTFR